MQLTDKQLYKAKRQALNITLKQIAEFAKCDISYLSKYEKNRYEPSRRIVERYKEYIDNF